MIFWTCLAIALAAILFGGGALGFSFTSTVLAGVALAFVAIVIYKVLLPLANAVMDGMGGEMEK